MMFLGLWPAGNCPPFPSHRDQAFQSGSTRLIFDKVEVIIGHWRRYPELKSLAPTLRQRLFHANETQAEDTFSTAKPSSFRDGNAKTPANSATTIDQLRNYMTGDESRAKDIRPEKPCGVWDSTKECLGEVGINLWSLAVLFGRNRIKHGDAPLRCPWTCIVLSPHILLDLALTRTAV